MKIAFLTFLLLLIVFTLPAQEYSLLPESASAVYEVNYQKQGPFVDSLFAELRKAWFREQAGIGEFTKERTIDFGTKHISYGVIVTYNLTQIIVRFYATLPKRKPEKVIEAIREDYFSVIKI